MTSEQESQSREAFEAAWMNQYPSCGELIFMQSHIAANRYINTRVNDGWIMWQACESRMQKRIDDLTAENTKLHGWVNDMSQKSPTELRQAKRISELEALINTPQTADWLEAVKLEAAHQIERWGSDHDAGKQPQDWFWLIGYLAGKALASAISGDVEKAKHHTISSGAALLNWHRAITGESTKMRPGIEDPQ